MIKLDFSVVGAAKCGTTALHHYLVNSPYLSLPNIKETNYFCVTELLDNCNGPGDNEFTKTKLISDQDTYVKLYNNKLIKGEVAPMYMYYPNVAERLYNNNSGMHIIFVLRNPIERAVSHYSHMIRDGRESLSLPEALRDESVREAQHWEPSWLYSKVSNYLPQIENYLSVFPRKQLHFFKYEDFSNDNNKVPQYIHSLFGLQYNEIIKKVRLNITGTPKIKFLNYILNQPSRLRSGIKAIAPKTLRVLLKNLLNEHNISHQGNEGKYPMLENIYNLEYYSRLGRITDLNLSNWVK